MVNREALGYFVFNGKGGFLEAIGGPAEERQAGRLFRAISNVFDQEVKAKGFSISKIKHSSDLTKFWNDIHLEKTENAPQWLGHRTWWLFDDVRKAIKSVSLLPPPPAGVVKTPPYTPSSTTSPQASLPPVMLPLPAPKVSLPPAEMAFHTPAQARSTTHHPAPPLLAGPQPLTSHSAGSKNLTLSTSITPIPPLSSRGKCLYLCGL